MVKSYFPKARGIEGAGFPNQPLKILEVSFPGENLMAKNECLSLQKGFSVKTFSNLVSYNNLKFHG